MVSANLLVKVFLSKWSPENKRWSQNWLAEKQLLCQNLTKKKWVQNMVAEEKWCLEYGYK